MMDEKTALTGTTTTTTTTTKEKKRYTTPLILVLFTFAALLFVGLAFSSAGRPMHGGTSYAAAAAGGGTTRGASTAVAKKTTTPTLQMFLELYPVVNNQSSEEQAQLYKVYLLHLAGATADDLDKYKSDAFNFWSCCLDDATSTGCKIYRYCDASPNAPNTVCYFEETICCRQWPLPNRVGSQAWPWTKCV